MLTISRVAPAVPVIKIVFYDLQQLRLVTLPELHHLIDGLCCFLRARHLVCKALSVVKLEEDAAACEIEF